MERIIFLADRIVAGVDEAGRGPLAGPVTAACVVLPPQYQNKNITDSKKLTAKRREKLFPEIVSVAQAFSVISVGPRRIERLNIREATRLAMKLAVDRVYRILTSRTFDKQQQLMILIDGNMLIETNHPQQAIIKGDEKILSIGAASILAKVTRDRLMIEIDKRYQEYGFEIHKGYPTELHQRRIKEFGPCKIHRRTFACVKEFVF